MSQKNFASYGDMETLLTEVASNRPTSFVGTRSKWNALPVATQVKYSLVNLIGEGVYKNNGTGLDKIADVGGGSSLTAGNYIEIDENNKINVKLQKGDYTEYEYRLTGAYLPVNQLTIEKYRDGALVSTESYRNDASYTPIAIDGLFEIWYSAGNPRYYWYYKLLEDSQEHSAGYKDSWYYTDTATRTETFNVDDESAELVTKGDIGTASAKNVPASGDAGNSEVVLGSDSRLTDSRPASDVSSWAKQATKPSYTASEVGAIPSTDKGANGGVAELDSNGLVPASQLPSYNDQTPTFTEASTRNNIASGEKLSVIFGKIQKFFNDLKTVAFTGSFSDLSNKPENSNTFQGTIAEWNALSTAEKKAYDHASISDSLDGNVTFPASKVMLNSGDSVEDGTPQFVGSTTIKTINTYNASWQATANGWCVGYMYSTSDHVAFVSVDGVEVARSGGTTYAANVTFPVSFPIKKGQTITTRNDSVTYYNIKVLAMG